MAHPVPVQVRRPSQTTVSAKARAVAYCAVNLKWHLRLTARDLTSRRCTHLWVGFESPETRGAFINPVLRVLNLQERTFTHCFMLTVSCLVLTLQLPSGFFYPSPIGGHACVRCAHTECAQQFQSWNICHSFINWHWFKKRHLAYVVQSGNNGTEMAVAQGFLFMECFGPGLNSVIILQIGPCEWQNAIYSVRVKLLSCTRNRFFWLFFFPTLELQALLRSFWASSQKSACLITTKLISGFLCQTQAAAPGLCPQSNQ